MSPADNVSTEEMRITLAGSGPLANAVLYNLPKLAAEEIYPYLPVAPPPAVEVLPGMIIMYGGTTLPTGWLWCDGSTVSQTTYASLYAALGANRYAPDAAGNFTLPDLRTRFPRGVATTGGVVTTNNAASTGNALSNHSHTVSVSAPIEVNAPQNAVTNRTSGNASANHNHGWNNTGNHAHGFAQSTTPNVNRASGNLGTAGNLTHGHAFVGDGAHNHTFGGDGATHTHTTNIDHRHNASSGDVDLTHSHTQSNPANVEVNFIIKT